VAAADLTSAVEHGGSDAIRPSRETAARWSANIDLSTP
jgi:hypothetical protein